MIKRYIIIGALLFSAYHLKAQEPDSVSKKTTLNKTEVDFVYNHYIQNGNNSAITGGIGTEKLTVFGPSIAYKKIFQGKKTIFIKGGADIISSASTDNIDFNVSSASSVDTRSYININYAQQVNDKNLVISGGSGFSIESDYFSLPLRFGVSFPGKNPMRSYSFNLFTFFDDLRWGRLDSDYRKPVRLIYPVELRYKNWFDIHNRYSYNFKFAFTQVINKKNILGVFPEIVYQHGLLSTPFHRVYFNDGDLKVENLPMQRLKGSLGIKLNSFLGGRTILKNELDFYGDTFGLIGFSIANETAIKLNTTISLAPFFRIYFQKASKYFAPYREHSIEQEFYTSDYDLSSFNTYKIGINFRYAPYKYSIEKLALNELQLRYSFMYRTNNLRAHIISLFINTSFYKEPPPPLIP